jgi:hypothetical protein
MHPGGRGVRGEGRVHAGWHSVGFTPGAEQEHDDRNQEQTRARATDASDDYDGL